MTDHHALTQLRILLHRAREAEARLADAWAFGYEAAVRDQKHPGVTPNPYLKEDGRADRP